MNTVYQSKSGHVYEISNTVRELPLNKEPILEGDDVVALVDADFGCTAPKDSVLRSRCRIIATAPPQDERSRGWMKQLSGGNVATAYMMDPFSLQEYFLTGFVHVFLSFCLI